MAAGGCCWRPTTAPHRIPGRSHEWGRGAGEGRGDTAIKVLEKPAVIGGALEPEQLRAQRAEGRGRKGGGEKGAGRKGEERKPIKHLQKAVRSSRVAGSDRVGSRDPARKFIRLSRQKQHEGGGELTDVDSTA